ncbi:MAG TPA: polyprenyl synthetase family protein [Nannocystaceae bacterium]|nr:polyprenyl synthetase family protein [Nannocystaceae bacterium]
MVRSDALEIALARSFRRLVDAGAPPRLRAAMRHAVFPGGARVRPRLVLGVAAACGADVEAAMPAAVAVELIHCASLVHDDLPCFDDAALRRGRATVHARFGESLAVLCGDGLIVAAFDELAYGLAQSETIARAVGLLATAASAGNGLVAGQAWEAEPSPELARYHHAKTGALFASATALGALAAGDDPARWRPLGAAFGDAFQIADDILDRTATVAELGKPVRQDLNHGRPSVVDERGVDSARARLDAIRRRALELVPPCKGRESLRAWLEELMMTLFARALGPTPDHAGASLSA